MTRKPSPGFTLMELMIAVAIMVLLAALAAPSFVDFFERNRVRAAADDVASLISNARAESVKNDLPVSVAQTGTGTTWCFGANAAALPSGGAPAGEATNCNCTVAAQCRVSGQRLVVSSADYGGVTSGVAMANLRIDNTLGAIATDTWALGTQQVTLTSPHGKYQLRVEARPLGQTRSCTPVGQPKMSGIAQCAN